MAEDLIPNANPYVDPQNAAFEQEFGKLTNGKPLTALSITEQRTLLDEFQAQQPNPAIETKEFSVSTAFGDIKSFLYKPKGKQGDLPVIFHLHGGAWALGGYVAWSPLPWKSILTGVHLARCPISHWWMT